MIEIVWGTLVFLVRAVNFALDIAVFIADSKYLARLATGADKLAATYFDKYRKSDAYKTSQQTNKVGSSTKSIVADPKFTWHFLTGTLWLNKKETKRVSTFSGAAAFAAGSLPKPWNWVVGGIVAILAAVASDASNNGRCVKITTGPWVSTYRGGYCK